MKSSLSDVIEMCVRSPSEFSGPDYTIYANMCAERINTRNLNNFPIALFCTAPANITLRMYILSNTAACDIA